MSRAMVRWKNGIRVVEPQINASGVHVYPFDVSFPLDVCFFTLQGRNSVRMNRHTYFELCYATAGKTRWQIQDRYFAVHKGDLVVIGSDLYHRPLAPLDAHSRLAFLFFEPKLVSGSRRTGEEMELLMPFLAQRSDFPHVVPAATGLPGEIIELMRRIHKELPATTASKRLATRIYLDMILMLLVKYYSDYTRTQEDFNRKRSDLERLRPVFDLLEERSHQAIHIAHAARLCAMSESHFMTFFKRATGQSFHTYLNHFRIARAQMFLTTTDKSLDRIGEEAGFCNQSYFGKIFRAVVGETPRAYRTRMKGGTAVGHVPILNDSVESAQAKHFRV